MLELCIKEILNGPWNFIQLRGEPLSTKDIDCGDIDFLGNMKSIDALFLASYRWVRQGLCHIHISARKFGKKALILYSPDGRHRLILDLWYSLPQLMGTKVPLTYEAIVSATNTSPEGPSISRLPVDIEACVYLHHLAAKKKNLTKEHNLSRLDNYLNRCENALVLRCVENVKAAKQVNSQTLSETLEIVLKIVDVKKTKQDNDHIKRLRQRTNGKFLCIMGCDGVGKTSLGDELAKNVTPPAKSFRGKRLYRRALTYKLFVKVLRPMFPLREQFDEFFVLPIYIRACFGLFLKQLFSHNNLFFFDRNLVDFLYIKRKTDNPSWSRYSRLSALCGKRVPTVHCIADFEIVTARKQEMTFQGHSLYDKSMFKHFSSRSPTEYTLFNNSDKLPSSRDALLNIILSSEYPLSSRFKVRKNVT